jgi:LTXXQ motif family protein
MWKLLIAGTAVSVIAGSTLLFAQQPPVPAATVLTGEERDQDNGWQSSAEDGRDNGGRPSAEDDQDNGWQPSDEVSQDEDNQQNGWQRSSEDNQEHAWQPSAEDTSAFMDARIAALKAGLRLTADQEKNWPAFETAVRDMAKVRADRWAMRQNEQPPADPVEWLQRRADALGKAAAGLKKLADAEGPLYKSLDDAQKHRFEVLAQGLGPHRHGWNCGWRHHQ